MYKEDNKVVTGYASIDKPWLKYYDMLPKDVEIPNVSLYRYIYDNNKNNLNDVALNYFHKKITYKELFDNVDKMFLRYSKLGIKKDDVVSMCCLTTPEILYSFFALNRIGAIVNWLDPRIGNNGIKNHINENDSKYLITLDVLNSKLNEFINDTTIDSIIEFSIGESLPKIKKILLSLKTKGKIESLNFKGKVYDESYILNTSINNEEIKSDYNNNLVSCIVYTGGTTGEPKAVMLSNRNFVAMAVQYSKLNVDMKRKDTFLSIIPPFFPYGICVSTYVPIALGLETIIIPKFDISMFSKLMMDYKPNHITGVPRYWEEFMKYIGNKNIDLSFIKSAGCGGDGMNAELERKMNVFLKKHNSSSKVMKGYGMTEVSAAAVTCTSNCNDIGSVGIPLICNTVSTFDIDTGKETSYLEDKVGEVCITGPCTMVGYRNNDEETNKLIKIHDDGLRWVHTGDCGRIDKDGKLYIEGRYKRIILRRGQTIYPNSIEDIIMQSGYVESVAVVAMNHPDLVNVPVVCVKVKDEYKDCFDIIKDNMQKMCMNNLPEYSLPYEYRMLDSMPYTNVGKIDFKSLEDMVNNKNNCKRLVLKKE